MKNNLLRVCLCMLILVLVPITAGATAEPPKDPKTSDIGWTTIQGIIFGVHEVNGGALLEFRCIFVHYVGQGILERTTGFRYGGQMMVIPGAFQGLLLPHMILGYCPDVLEF